MFQNISTSITLSIYDLLHEWKQTFCLVFTIVGVVTPLLLLFGLKHGSFTTTRERFVQDPRNREIIPLTAMNYSKEWFDKVAVRPDVAFLLPKTREIATMVYAQVARTEDNIPVSKSGFSNMIKLDTLPTGPGDPLLLENSVRIPEKGGCVLTHHAAEQLNAQSGDRLICVIDRMLSKQYETVSLTLDVIGILPDRAGTLEIVYMPLSMVNAIETYRHGGAVPELGWPGKTNRIQPRYNGFTLITRSPIPREQLNALTNGTGFFHIQQIKTGDAERLLGFNIPGDVIAYLLYVEQGTVGAESLNTLKEKINSVDTLILPYIKPINAWVADSKDNHAVGITLANCLANGLTYHASGFDHLQNYQYIDNRETLQDALKITLPGNFSDKEVGGSITLIIGKDDQRYSFPVQIIDVVRNNDNACIPSELAGVINAIENQEKNSIIFDSISKDFYRHTDDYVSFRMYAQSVDDVDLLRRFLAQQGIEAVTKADEIERVKSVDHGLSRIYWLIAVAGIAGCLATLSASFASSVEQKKRSLGVLRLMGMSGATVFYVPFCQAVIIGFTGFATASAVYFLISRIINQLFIGQMQAGPALCTLTPQHFAIAFLGTLSVVILSSLGAAWQATRIDPADVLREE